MIRALRGGSLNRMPFFLLHHQHGALECDAAFAAWQGFVSPPAPAAGGLHLPGGRPCGVVARGGARSPGGARTAAALRRPPD